MEKKYLVSTDGYMESIMCDELNRKFIVSTETGIHKVIEAYCKEHFCIYKKDSVYVTGKTIKFIYADNDDPTFDYVIIGTWHLIEILEV